MKSNWKYFRISQQNLQLKKQLLFKIRNIKFLTFTKRSLQISAFILGAKAAVHQGKFIVRFGLTTFHKSYKLGQFTKTRKPFFFRSKKKKK